eukprot:scaffold12103_cov21-Cyclotella_meneghiniana.AAC.2
MSHQDNKRQKHAPSSSDMIGLQVSPPDASQWTQMRQEIMDSLRAELQNDFQSQVDQLKAQTAQLEGEASRLQNENSQLKSKVASLEEKVNSLEHLVIRAERKEKYLEMVKRNEQWEYPLDVPTIAELVSDGYSEEQSEEIIRQIDYIKNVTTQMRKGEAKYCITVDFYYEGMLPHYRQFADALMDYRHTIDYMDDTSFLFAMRGAAQLPAQVLLWLEKALEHTHFHRLQFCPIQTEGVRYLDFISNFVKANTRLKDFRLYDVTIENSRDIDLLCEVLNNKATLEEIELTYCGTEGGVFQEIFNKLQTQNVHKIDLSDNHLSNLRPTDMSEFLSSNSSLRDLDLGDNPFNEQDIVYIADTLRRNTTLCTLHFRFRFRGPSTNWHLLEYAIFDYTSLNAAYDSNHHCRLYIHMPGSDIWRFNTYSDPTLNRRKKIYTLLSKRNRRRENASFLELDGTGIKHIPQILSLLKPFSEHHSHNENGIQEDEAVTPLSIAYEIMRDWRMPELYNLDQMKED